MAKNKEKRKLPKASDVPAVKPLLAEVEKRKAIVAKAKAKATKDGKFNKYDPKYRDALRRFKKIHRLIRKEILRHLPKELSKKKAAAAAASQAKPAEAKAPEAKAPEAKAPEAKAPEAKAPEAKAPEAKAPEAPKA